MLDLDGRPTVLAFVKAWHPELASTGELRAMRAQLRGLGAALVILSDAGAWSFRPDDELERFERGGATDRAIADMARRRGIDRDRDALFVLDGCGGARFEHVAARRGPLPLAGALAAAGDALVARGPVLASTRREWALTCLCTGFALALVGCRSSRDEQPAAPSRTQLPAEYDVVLDVNGTRYPMRLEARVSLLDALRERIGLTGTKKGCDHGQCGACTVHADGRRILACMTLAVMAQHQRITTIEGLATGDRLHPMQAAFVEHDGFQCGYCTPGQIMSAVALLAEGHASSDADVREWMSGNLCRCGAYPNIVAAIRAAQKGA